MYIYVYISGSPSPSFVQLDKKNALGAVDSLGRGPLHVACARADEINVKLADALVEVYIYIIIHT